ncbi:sugar ABC transporter substrate-binding protein [Phaeobacter italicus]|jgi:ABC-type sugar transport system substrate-binding protein|uniref:sugar ABC transporter substrate-binding protein n=1 Tax=Phaeobacter italicus TaxID=481446 RepID=UPI00232CEAAC|nr:sugar ABC transporter substrate-binding protein [Phaeobacter italicus]
MKKITQTLTAALCYGVLGMAPALAQDIGSVTTEDVRRAATDACDDGSVYRVAYSHSVSEVAIVKQVRRFADERARYLGCVEVLHDNTQANNLEQQINAIQGWITLGVDAIVVLPIEPTALQPLQRQAQAQGIKWLTYLGEMEGSDGFVGFNHAQSGQIIAEAAVDWAKENNVEAPKALVTTLTPLPSLAPRWTEVTRIFEENGIEVVAQQDAADQTNGLRVAETVLQQHPDLDIVIGMADDAAVGALRAIKLTGADASKIFVGGQDGSLEGLSAVNDGGAYRASAAILINELGANIVDLALNAVRGNGPSFAYTPTVLATKANQELLDNLLTNYDR